MTKNLLAVAIAAALVTACGGSDSNEPAVVAPADTAATSDTGSTAATGTSSEATDTSSVTENTDTGSAAETITAAVISVNGGNADTPLKAGVSSTITIELRDEEGRTLTGERKVRLEIVDAQENEEKAAFTGVGKTLEVTFTNGIGYVAIIPDAGETSVTLRLTDRNSGSVITITLTAEASVQNTTDNDAGQDAELPASSNSNAIPSGICTVFGGPGCNPNAPSIDGRPPVYLP